MNYTQIHDSIINRAKFRTLNEYSEKHHIIPKCLGGVNDKSNIVSLTAKEHYLVHLLLTKIHFDNKKLIYAFWMMSNRMKVKISSGKLYQEAKQFVSSTMRNNVGTPEAITKMSKSKKGNIIWLGKKHSKETKNKQSESAKNRNISIESEQIRRQNISKNSKKPKSLEHIESIRKSKLGENNPMFGKKWKLVDGKRVYYIP